jgi:hypothetical protein
MGKFRAKAGRGKEVSVYRRVGVKAKLVDPPKAGSVRLA